MDLTTGEIECQSPELSITIHASLLKLRHFFFSKEGFKLKKTIQSLSFSYIPSCKYNHFIQFFSVKMKISVPKIFSIKIQNYY